MTVAGAWQILAAFAVGFLINSATDWVRKRSERQTKLKATRAELYQHLYDYREYLMLTGHLERGATQLNREELDKQMSDTWQRVRSVLISSDDKKYSRLVGEIQFFRGGAVKVMADDLEPIIKELREDLPYLRKLEEELYAGEHKDFVRRNRRN